MAEDTEEIEIFNPRLGVPFPNPSDIAILAAGRTICYPPGKIRNISVDGIATFSLSIHRRQL